MRWKNRGLISMISLTHSPHVMQRWKECKPTARLKSAPPKTEKLPIAKPCSLLPHLRPLLGSWNCLSVCTNPKRRGQNLATLSLQELARELCHRLFRQLGLTRIRRSDSRCSINERGDAMRGPPMNE